MAGCRSYVAAASSRRVAFSGDSDPDALLLLPHTNVYARARGPAAAAGAFGRLGRYPNQQPRCIHGLAPTSCDAEIPMPFVLALDQGTTSSRAILFDTSGSIVATSQREFSQIFPRSGWVEHDPVEIWESQIGVAEEVLQSAGLQASDVAAVGITNQRETTVIWDRATGEPIHNAIVWQDRRTAATCDQLKSDGCGEMVREKTGLVIDAYFSGTKAAWILDQIPGGQKRAEAGELAFGTIDSWLVYQLTGGECHITDVSNASRTMLYNIEACVG